MQAETISTTSNPMLMRAFVANFWPLRPETRADSRYHELVTIFARSFAMVRIRNWKILCTWGLFWWVGVEGPGLGQPPTDDPSEAHAIRGRESPEREWH